MILTAISILIGDHVVERVNESNVGVGGVIKSSDDACCTTVKCLYPSILGDHTSEILLGVVTVVVGVMVLVLSVLEC